MSGAAIGWVFDHSPMSGAPFLVQLALADVANDMHGNELWCSTGTIARKTRLARFTVTRALATLVENEQIELVEERPGKASRYRMRLLPPATTSGTPPVDPPSPVAPPATTDGNTCHQEWHELNRTEDDNPSRAHASECGELPFTVKPRDPNRLDALRRGLHDPEREDEVS